MREVWQLDRTGIACEPKAGAFVTALLGSMAVGVGAWVGLLTLLK